MASPEQVEALAAMRKALFTADTEALLKLGQYEEVAAAILAVLDGWTLVESDQLDFLRLDHGFSPRPAWAGECRDCGAKGGEDCRQIGERPEIEIARLRAALEEIAGDEFSYPMGGPAQTMADIARAALAPESQP